MIPDDICEKYLKEKVQVNIYSIEDKIVLEGNSNSLLFLADIIKAVSEDASDDSFSLGPNGAGRKFFKKNSDYGIIIHKLNDSSGEKK